MPFEQWINIDNISDWEKAEKILLKHENSYKKGSVKEFDDSWKEQIHETRQNYYTSGHPSNQIMMSFKNQWQVYKLFIGPIMSGMKVLEPGSGRGSISCYFAANGFDCYLLDTSQEVLEVAKSIFNENNLKANYICDDALNMPFQASYFDVIVHCGLLEHFEDYQKALGEQYRVLAPGGIIIANIVPEKFSIQKAFKFVNDFLAFSYKFLSQLKLVKKVNKTPKQLIDTIVPDF